ncbi:hypothetical protein [Clostridium baratii]|uniref:hypothetical protein n=1 Tax=Clostridium baratii TaxID=1561 RepID=UPI002941D506|nr:hypothetical protein [Clostridium baratii]
MLSDTLQRILNMMKNKFDISDATLEKIIIYISTKNKGTYVYPEVLEEKFGLDMNKSFKICVFLEKRSLLKRVYKLYCPNCQEIGDEMFDSFNEIEDYGYCEICGKNLIDEKNPYKYIFIYFKVI